MLEQQIAVRPEYRPLLRRLLAGERGYVAGSLRTMRERDCWLTEDEQDASAHALALDRGADEIATTGRLALGPDLTASDLAAILERHADACVAGLSDRASRPRSRDEFRFCADLLDLLDRSGRPKC